ncbi:phage virion morphogenesis protein [Neisseria weaveri]|uniref:Phage-like protein n=1 Tax=Neisseria weaveri TaxID=28091 RepID=A0A448VJU8_9NEIS|nr:phage virion morphogenesis protein [Neisseria weaveri]EGV38410.1 phage virion morphogeneis protein [Neisseria weaveri LMG 5135]VEJ50079.1 phage-like protein [Neisseria weaveri]
MLEISLDDKQLQKGLGQLLKNATDTRPMMRAIATDMVSLTEDNFESESWGGQKWPRSKRAASGRGKTLQLSGQLAASISTKVGNDFARIGSNKKYAAIHHLGGTIKAKNKPYLVFPVAGGGLRKVKSVNIPARPYLPINGTGQLQNGAERSLLDIALKSLSKGL